MIWTSFTDKLFTPVFCSVPVSKQKYSLLGVQQLMSQSRPSYSWWCTLNVNEIDVVECFYRASICEGVLGVVILSVCPSVRLSLRPSHACIVTKLNDALQIFLYHMKGQSLCYSDTKSGWLATPPSLWNLRSKWLTPFEKRRLRPISAHNVSTVGDSEKSSITTNIKLTTGFPTSHRWSAYVTPKCPKGWLKERFYRFWV